MRQKILWRLCLLAVAFGAAAFGVETAPALGQSNATRQRSRPAGLNDAAYSDMDYAVRQVDAAQPPQDDELDPKGLFPGPSEEPPKKVSPPFIEHGYDRVSEGAYDAVGSYQDSSTQLPDRPAYPYGATNDWYGHAANVEEWGDLLELPYVQLGWFANAEASLLKARVAPHFDTVDLLDAFFPGDPITLGASSFDWTVAPRIEAGYRFEHGLGDIRGSYRYIGDQGNQPIAGYDSGANGVIGSKINLHVVDLDLSYLEYNPEGVPIPFPLFLVPGRLGLGRPLFKSFFLPPLEYRRYFGFRYSNFYYSSIATGDIKTERVTNNFNGGGLHFGTEFNQQIAMNQPYFAHVKLEGSGIFGVLNQSYQRTQGGVFGEHVIRGDGMGIPTLAMEIGLSWRPSWPERHTRFTAAYQLEEWFSFADTRESNANLIMDAFVFRIEHKY